MHFQGGIIMKIKRWIAFGIGTLLIIMLLWIYGSFNGLITSKLWVKHCANGYIQEHYKEYDFQLNEVNYNFKDGLYNAKIVSPTSEDSTFSLAYDWTGKLIWNSYEENVIEKWNTMQRIDMQYRKYSDQVIVSKDFPFSDSEICFGSIQWKDEIETMRDGTLLYEPFGLDKTQIKLDQQFDSNELGREAGYLVIYVQDDEVSIKKAASLLLELKTYMDQRKVLFHAVDFHLQKTSSGHQESSERIDLIKFMYKDIKAEEIDKKIEKCLTITKQYYEEKDHEKAEEMY